MNYIGAIWFGDILGQEKSLGLTAIKFARVSSAFWAFFICCWAFWALHLSSPNTPTETFPRRSSPISNSAFFLHPWSPVSTAYRCLQLSSGAGNDTEAFQDDKHQVAQRLLRHSFSLFKWEMRAVVRFCACAVNEMLTHITSQTGGTSTRGYKGIDGCAQADC